MYTKGCPLGDKLGKKMKIYDRGACRTAVKLKRMKRLD
jgi:hypothetical protein